MSRGLTAEGEESGDSTVGAFAVEPPVLSLDMAARDAVSLIDHHEGRAGVVLAGESRVVGLLTREAADKAADDATVEAAMELGPKTYRADGDPADALEFMTENGLDQVLVTDPMGKLIGMLTREAAREAVEAAS